MKILHWVFVFLAIILPVSIACRNTVNSRFIALRDEVRINNAIDTATKDAIDQIIAISTFDYDDEFGEVINITPELAQESINTFFHTMAVNYNIPFKISDVSFIDENENQSSYIKDYFSTYIPAVVVIAYDGFYVYSQEKVDGGYYKYQLSQKIPFTKTYDDGRGKSYTVGYTLKDDIYFYYDGKCYSGKMKYNNIDDIRTEYNNNYSGDSTDVISLVTNDMSMILYSLKQNSRVSINDNLLPADGVTNFLQDYERDENGLFTSAGPFHAERRNVIVNIIKNCLREEINEHKSYANILGCTYNFALPDIPNDDWVNSIEDISVMAFIQGIPVGTAKGKYFNNYALGGSRIVKKDYIYGKTDESGVKLYHTANCEHIAGEDYEVYFTSQEDAAKNGYWPCLDCN